MTQTGYTLRIEQEKSPQTYNASLVCERSFYNVNYIVMYVIYIFVDKFNICKIRKEKTLNENT